MILHTERIGKRIDKVKQAYIYTVTIVYISYNKSLWLSPGRRASLKCVVVELLSFFFLFFCTCIRISLQYNKRLATNVQTSEYLEAPDPYVYCVYNISFLPTNTVQPPKPRHHCRSYPFWASSPFPMYSLGDTPLASALGAVHPPSSWPPQNVSFCHKTMYVLWQIKTSFSYKRIVQCRSSMIVWFNSSIFLYSFENEWYSLLYVPLKKHHNILITIVCTPLKYNIII